MRMCGSRNQIRITSKNSGSTLTLNQLKLAVALELRSEGYENIVFDKVIECFGRKIRIHIFAEDELGSRIAVHCVNRTADMNPRAIFDLIHSIRSNVEDCEVTLVFPLSLLSRASAIIGMTSRIFAVDHEGRVWVHYPFEDTRLVKALREAFEDTTEDESDQKTQLAGNQSVQLRVPYIA
ncbi:MAG: hypothetical protein QXO71_12725 [Candidatus Jordarchaeaceae archaeon]